MDKLVYFLLTLSMLGSSLPHVYDYIKYKRKKREIRSRFSRFLQTLKESQKDNLESFNDITDLYDKSIEVLRSLLGSKKIGVIISLSQSSDNSKIDLLPKISLIPAMENMLLEYQHDVSLIMQKVILDYQVQKLFTENRPYCYLNNIQENIKDIDIVLDISKLHVKSMIGIPLNRRKGCMTVLGYDDFSLKYSRSRTISLCDDIGNFMFESLTYTKEVSFVGESGDGPKQWFCYTPLMQQWLPTNDMTKKLLQSHMSTLLYEKNSKFTPSNLATIDEATLIHQLHLALLVYSVIGDNREAAITLVNRAKSVLGDERYNAMMDMPYFSIFDKVMGSLVTDNVKRY